MDVLGPLAIFMFQTHHVLCMYLEGWSAGGRCWLDTEPKPSNTRAAGICREQVWIWDTLTQSAQDFTYASVPKGKACAIQMLTCIFSDEVGTQMTNKIIKKYDFEQRKKIFSYSSAQYIKMNMYCKTHTSSINCIKYVYPVPKFIWALEPLLGCSSKAQDLL